MPLMIYQYLTLGYSKIISRGISIYGGIELNILALVCIMHYF